MCVPNGNTGNERVNVFLNYKEFAKPFENYINYFPKILFNLTFLKKGSGKNKFTIASNCHLPIKT